jgi:hypothetical protein
MAGLDLKSAERVERAVFRSRNVVRLDVVGGKKRGRWGGSGWVDKRQSERGGRVGRWGGRGVVGGIRLPRLRFSSHFRKIKGYKACAKFRGSTPALVDA